MKRRLTAGLIALAGLVSLAGCMGKVKYPNYYTLHVSHTAQLPTQPEARPEARGSVAIRRFQSPGYLHQGAIVYRTSPEQLGFYDYHRWAVDPREFVTNAIADRLRASGKFADVKIYDGRSDVDYILSGTLENLDEVDYGGGVQVEVALSAQMTELRTGLSVWANSVSDIAKVDQRNVPAVVAEMSSAMDRAIQKLTSSIQVSSKPDGR